MKSKTTPKLALVAQDRLPEELCDYALEVAVRLDLDIIILFAGEKSDGQSGSAEEQKQIIEEQAAAFSARAWRKSVQVTTVVDVAEPETALKRLQKGNPDVCFVLTSSEHGPGSSRRAGRHRLTVIRQE